jgi:hypothetical protein
MTNQKDSMAPPTPAMEEKYTSLNHYLLLYEQNRLKKGTFEKKKPS